ncbi:hypothetical protein QBC44DRAFT_318905 [Cladorrhinum sp. PSN332]|nr:hypothetical protein QBC44DRAFT_318905 [Cladorrhinum sp. PSN332]
MNKQGTPDLSSLPLDKCHFNFIGEGAANLVFEVVIDPSPEVKIDENVKAIFRENLLRVPKAGAKTHPHQELQQHWETVISPLFPPQNLVQQRLIKIGGPSVISQLNSALDQETETRRHEFKDTRVANAEYGMLVEDMRAKSPTSLAIEFKPKWLAQSPNAPPKAARCRTCAREALRSHKKGGKLKNIPCPLHYVACNDNDSDTSSPPSKSRSLTTLLTSLLPPSSSSSSSTTTTSDPHSHLTNWFRTNSLLPALRQAQLSNDTTGPLDPKNNPEKLALAMTLRDCSVFLRIPISDDPKAQVEAKLADLDKKDIGRKLEYWRELETDMIQGGYYEGKETPRQKTNCFFESFGK